MNHRTPIRILIADDHLVVRMGLIALLQRQRDFRVVAEAADAEAAFTGYQQHRPDVALLDLRMPPAGGLQALRRIHAAAPEARVLILSTYDTEEEIHAAFENGARGYVLKDAGRQELIAAIRSVAAGDRWIPPEIQARLAEREDWKGLTARELDVLQLVAKGLTNKEIAAILGTGDQTVKTHVSSLLQKLGAADRTEAAALAIQRGIVSA